MKDHSECGVIAPLEEKPSRIWQKSKTLKIKSLTLEDKTFGFHVPFQYRKLQKPLDENLGGPQSTRNY